VGNHTEVIDFCAFFNDRFAEGGAVNSGIGSYADVVFNAHNAQLWDAMIVAMLVWRKAKTLRTNDCACLDGGVFANDTAV
jgi:hypothetical protein